MKYDKIRRWIKNHITITNEWKDIKTYGDFEIVSIYYNNNFKFLVFTLSNFRIQFWF